MKTLHPMIVVIVLLSCAAFAIAGPAPAVRPGWTGIVMVPLRDPNPGAHPISALAVRRVVPGSPAAKAGLQAGDVVTAFDGRAIRAAHEAELLLQLATLRAGKPVSLKVRRGPKSLELRMVPAEMDDRQFELWQQNLKVAEQRSRAAATP
jgi:S1-C subfamily serine protease